MEELILMKRWPILLGSLCFWACAVDLREVPTPRLCNQVLNYQSPQMRKINPVNDARLEELNRRGEDCSEYVQ